MKWIEEINVYRNSNELKNIKKKIDSFVFAANKMQVNWKIRTEWRGQSEIIYVARVGRLLFIECKYCINFIVGESNNVSHDFHAQYSRIARNYAGMTHWP